DAAMIVVDKPAGLVVHPAAGNRSGTLVNALLAHCGESLSGIGGVRRPGIVHRLDKDTSGLMVVAKTDRAHRALAAQFADHGRSGPLARGYLAFAWGVPDRPKGTIDAPINRHPPPPDPARRCAQAAAMPSPTGRSWSGIRARTAARSRACSPAGSRPAARIRSASTSPISATRCWATTSMALDSRPKRPCWRPARGKPWRMLADRPCMLIYWASNIRLRADSWSSARNCRSRSLVYDMNSLLEGPRVRSRGRGVAAGP